MSVVPSFLRQAPHALRALVAVLLAGGLVVALPLASAGAQGPPPSGSLDQIVLLYRNSMPGIEAAVGSFALRLFALLAVLEFCYAGVRLVFKGADLGEWMAELTNQVLFIGFFLTLLLNSGPWATALVNSFRHAGSAASVSAGGSGNMGPSDIVGIGIDLASQVAAQTTLFEPAQSLGLILCAILLLCCFALIALFMVEALVQSYVIIAAGALFMGFGGSRWTKDFAIKIITAALAVGAKLFVLQLLVGLGEAMMRGWLTVLPTTFQGIFVMLGASLVMVGLTKSIPDLVQSLINGGAFAGGSGLLGAASMAGSTAGAFAGGMAGAGLAVAGAGRLASEQLATQALTGSAPGSRAGRLAALTGGTFRNLGSAAFDDVGAKLGGRAHHGTMPGRMADRLHSEAKVMASERRRQEAAPAGAAGPTRPGRSADAEEANTIGVS